MFVFKDVILFQNLDYCIYYKNPLDSCFSYNTSFNIENRQRSYGIFFVAFSEDYPVTDWTDCENVEMRWNIKYVNILQKWENSLRILGKL